MNKDLLLAIVAALVVQSTSIGFTLVKARATDVTNFSLKSFMTPDWYWQNKYLLLSIAAIGFIWLFSSLMVTQLSNYLSNGEQTASTTAVIFGIAGTITGFLQYTIYRLIRAERIPPIGFNTFWLLLAGLTALSVVTLIVNVALLNELARLQTPLEVPH